MLTENKTISTEDCLPEAILFAATEAMEQKHSRSYLIKVLHMVQQYSGYLKKEHTKAVAEVFKMNHSELISVASFYSYFKFVPQGKHKVSVCMGTACHVKGAEKILEEVLTLTGIDDSGISPDGMFSLSRDRCVGTCAMAPVLILDGVVHGNVKPEQVPELFKKFDGNKE